MGTLTGGIMSEIIVDQYRKIASGKSICEDYIISKQSPERNYVILSDGCSSSKHTDVGARILVHLAEKYLNQLDHELLTDYGINEYHAIGNRVIIAAKLMMEFFVKDNTWLDASLSIMFNNGNDIHVFMYGDGYVITKDLDGDITYLEVEYKNNAPYYLSYLLDDKRSELYFKEYEGEVRVNCVGKNRFHDSIIPSGYSNGVRANYPLYFKFSKDEFKSIMIASDGISDDTFRGLDFDQFLKYITDSPVSIGKMLQRDCKWTMNQMEKKGIVNYDDIAIGLFYFPR